MNNFHLKAGQNRPAFCVVPIFFKVLPLLKKIANQLVSQLVFLEQLPLEDLLFRLCAIFAVCASLAVLAVFATSALLAISSNLFRLG